MENKSNGPDYSKGREIQARGIKMKRKPMFDQAHTTLLNGIKINFEKGFGFHQDQSIKNNAYCIDDNRIIYILASQIVLYDLLAQSQKVIDQFDYDEEIGSMIYFKNIMLEDNIIYAVHNSSKSFPSLVMHNFSKNFNQKFMLANLEKQERINQIVLFNDFRSIAIISNFDKIIRLSVIEAATKQIKISQFLSFNPKGLFSISQFPTKLLLQGPNQIFVTDIEHDFKLQPLSAKKWLQADQKIVQITTSLNLQLCIYLITNMGNLYFLYTDIKQLKVTKSHKLFLGTFKTVDHETSKQIQVSKRPSSICANQYNILIGYELLEQFTLVKIYTVSTQMPTLEIIKFSCPYLHKIVRMNFAAETMAVCVIVQVKQNDKYDFSIPIDSHFFKQRNQDKIMKQNINNHRLKQGKIFPIIFNLLLYDTLVQTLRSPVQTILNPLLMTKKILDICVLPTKKLILILSADKRIKAIKYQNVASISFEKMVAWQMIFNQNDHITSLDVHPLIFTVAVGFKQGIKLFTMFSDGIKPANIQFPLKNCECVKYSKFGHMLIAGSSNQIIMISPYENRIISTIQLSYSFNTKQLAFIDRDMYLSVAYQNGSMQVMNLEGQKIFEVWNKSCKCITSFYDPIFDITIMSYQDNQVKFYRQRGQMQFAIMWTFPFLITKILVVNQLGTVFMGTSTGKIRAYQWPFTDMIKFNKSFTQIQLHRSVVTQIKISHNYSHLITGSEDGSVFISKLTAYSDGMVVNDSSILHTFKINKKNYTSLYYLQNLSCTNNSRQSQKQEQIIQYQLDKVDFQTDQNFTLHSLKQQIQQCLKTQEKTQQNLFKEEISPFQLQIQTLNNKKLELHDELSKLQKHQNKQNTEMEEDKLNKMRKLYKDSDHLKIKINFYTKVYKEQIQKVEQECKKQFKDYLQQMKQNQYGLLKDCEQLEKDLQDAKISYVELMKQQEEEGKIYKKKMMEKLEQQFSFQKQKGEQLRKIMNKNNHQIHTIEDKHKFFSHIITELSLDIDNNQTKQQNLQKQIEQLLIILKQKDQQIFDEQKAVKELLKKSINNYSHQQYLKHKQDELIAKAKYLQKQIQNLDDKYLVFQDNFIDASKQNNEQIQKIQQAYQSIEELKSYNKSLKQKKYMTNYKYKQVYSQIMDQFHACHSKKIFTEKVSNILEQSESKVVIPAQNQAQCSHPSSLNKKKTQLNLHAPSPSLSPSNSPQLSQPAQAVSCQHHQQQTQWSKLRPNIDKRDHLIDQVLNNNKLRKIDDTIRRTIMIKLNRQTVNLTSQVNQLRKQKKKLSIKNRDLLESVQQLQKQLPCRSVRNPHSLAANNGSNINSNRCRGNKNSNTNINSNINKQNILNSNAIQLQQTSLTDIIPAHTDISMIRSQNSKHLSSQNSRNRPSPFQIYHANKQQTVNCNSGHSICNSNNKNSKAFTKSVSQQNSTQLPSIIKSYNYGNNNQSYSGSILQQTNLQGVQQIDDDEIMGI